jgi:hypothetical protein
MRLDLMSIALGAFIGTFSSLVVVTYQEMQKRAAIEAVMAEDARAVKCAHEGDEFVCRWKKEVKL